MIAKIEPLKARLEKYHELNGEQRMKALEFYDREMAIADKEKNLKAKFYSYREKKERDIAFKNMKNPKITKEQYDLETEKLLNTQKKTSQILQELRGAYREYLAVVPDINFALRYDSFVEAYEECKGNLVAVLQRGVYRSRDNADGW